MTINLNFITVANSISNLSISGVTIRDLDEIPQGGSLILPVLYPQPVDFMTGWTEDVLSFGLGITAAINATYTLHYVFLFCEAGAGVSQLDVIVPLATSLKAILKVFVENDVVTGLVDMKPTLESFGVLQDASGSDYWGALIALNCLEHVQ